MSTAPFDHPFLSGLLGDDETAGHFTAERDLAEMIRFEAALAGAEGEHGIIPADAADHIADVCSGFSPDMAALRAGTQTDGVVVPDLVRQLRAAMGDDVAPFVHVGATSQDVIDTSLILRLQPVLDIFDDRLQQLQAVFSGLAETFGDRPLMAKTRMQSALPIRVADRVRNWAEPLSQHRAGLAALRAPPSRLQFGGAVGTLDALGDKAAAVRASLASRLGLTDPLRAWHVQRSHLGEFAGWLSNVSASLGKFGTDLALMAQDEIGSVRLATGGSSSAMPHKHNPIDAETLTTLARYTATQLGGMHQALVHEQERSGAMWTLEWMILPSMVMTTGTSLKTALRVVGTISDLGDRTSD